MVVKTMVNIIPEVSITPEASSLRERHHSRSNITPERTSLQEQHHSRSNITPEAKSFQQSPILSAVPSPFRSLSLQQKPTLQRSMSLPRSPSKRRWQSHCGFVDAVTPNTPAVLVTMVDTVNMVSETPSHKLCPSLYHTSDPHAAVGSTSNITSQWSPSSQKRSPHQHIFHDRQANSTSKRTKQNRTATQTLCPMNIHKHHPCKIAKVILPRLQDCEYIPAPPLPTSLLSYTHHVSTWVVIIHGDVSSGHMIHLTSV